MRALITAIFCLAVSLAAQAAEETTTYHNPVDKKEMKAKPPGKLRDGAQCKVIGGVHVGKSGLVTDIKTSKTGHVTITVVQPDGERFKTLAKNVVI